MRTNLSTAWRILGAKPRNPVWSWSAWPLDGSRGRLFVTLPQRDFLPEAPTDIPLWDASWSDASPGKAEQRRNLQEALAAGVPIVGFIVVQNDGSDHITDTFPQRPLALNVVENTAQRIVARATAIPSEVLTKRIEPKIAVQLAASKGDVDAGKRSETASTIATSGMRATDAQELFAEMLRTFPPATLPKGIVHPPYQSNSIDFFPGGPGTCEREAPFPIGGVMVLGHNYGSVDDFTRNVAQPETSWRNSAWATCRKTWTALQRWGIAPRECFFTNFYVGLVAQLNDDGTPFNVGAHPQRNNSDFVRRCREFFVTQVHAQRPRLLLVLGSDVPPLLAELSPRLRGWSPCLSFAALDADNAGTVHGLTIGGQLCNACVVTHPCMPNSRYRTFGTLRGEDAETAMVRSLLDVTDA